MAYGRTDDRSTTTSSDRDGKRMGVITTKRALDVSEDEGVLQVEPENGDVLDGLPIASHGRAPSSDRIGSLPPSRRALSLSFTLALSLPLSLSLSHSHSLFHSHPPTLSPVVCLTQLPRTYCPGGKTTDPLFDDYVVNV